MERKLLRFSLLTGAMLASTAAVADPAAPVEKSAVPSATREFRDSDQTPMMRVIPAGAFDMGSPVSEPGRSTFEDAQHRVTIAHAFALAENDITFDQWDACVADGGCNGYSPGDQGWGRGSRPVINVSWDDALAYVAWLNAKTNRHYRLPTEAEWEYAARAGTSTVYWWGDVADHDHANYGNDKCCSGLTLGVDTWTNTAPVGSFAANPWGLFDMNGNVMQLVADCWHSSYAGAPADGSAWAERGCSVHPARGGSWSGTPAFIRSADRIFVPENTRRTFMGFRVARDM